MHLIDDIFADNFLQRKLGFSYAAELDCDKLIVGGHSFGGMTAISVAEKDLRIKAVFCFDAWTWAKDQEILSGNLNLTQPQIHIITEHFPALNDKVFSMDLRNSINSVIKFGKSEKN